MTNARIVATIASQRTAITSAVRSNPGNSAQNERLFGSGSVTSGRRSSDGPNIGSSV
mgnify:CR=1 FL=1